MQAWKALPFDGRLTASRQTHLRLAMISPGLIVVHNHPSGDPTPSQDDARLTVRLCQASDVLDIGLLDHLIVGDAERYFSFREAGALQPITR